MEEGSAGGADVEAAFGVPLDAEEEAAGGMFHVEQFGFHGLIRVRLLWDEFDSFDDLVVGAAGYDAESVAADGYGLVMAGVDGEAEVGCWCWVGIPWRV